MADSQNELALLRQLETAVRCYAWRPGKDAHSTVRRDFNDLLCKLERVRQTPDKS